jgi:hypothetical protein
MVFSPTHRRALLPRNIVFLLLLISVSPKATRNLEPIGYRGALLNTLLHATVYMFLLNLLNFPVQIANKMGLQKEILLETE